MAVQLFIVAFALMFIIPVINGIPEPSSYVLSFDTSDNPLNISVIEPYSKNYFITIGDFGAADSEFLAIQKGVASKMQSFYESQKSKGYNLLFVAAVGDNFYWTGQNCDTWTSQWSDIYGDQLTSVPWLAIMGNHDWGNNDPNALCAFNNPRYIDPSTGIAYASNQLTTDKKGCAPTNYYMPDFGWYYTINELSLEIIGLEQNVYDCPDGISGGSTGSDDLFANCNSSDTIGCDYMGKMAIASELMMNERSISSINHNFLLIQHYPSRASTILNEFKSNRVHNGSDDIIWEAYGHAHIQECDGYSDKNSSNCELIMTGGGGGCCSEDTLRGFFVIGFDDNKNMVQEYSISDSQLTCQYPCTSDNYGGDVNDIYYSKELEFGTCCDTKDDISIDCNNFDLDTCQ